MIDAKKVMDMIKMKKEEFVVRDKTTGKFVEPKPGMSGNYEFLNPSMIDDMILQEVFGEKVGQNELMVVNVLQDLLQKKLAPSQLKRVAEKLEDENLLVSSYAKKRKRTKQDLS